MKAGPTIYFAPVQPAGAMSNIHIKYPALTIKAGRRAMTRIREQGLSPIDVGIIPGAAGGPKALGIQGLDLALFG